jgi:hypothetical protein
VGELRDLDVDQRIGRAAHGVVFDPDIAVRTLGNGVGGTVSGIDRAVPIDAGKADIMCCYG